MERDAFWTLHLSPDELYLLVALLRLPLPLVPQDPFTGTDDDTQRRLQRAQASLAARGYIQDGADDAVTVDVAVAAFVEAVCAPVCTWVLSAVHADGTLVERHIHQAALLTIEQESPAENRVSLTAVRDRGVLARRVRSVLRLYGVETAPGEPFTLERAMLDGIRDAALEGGAAECLQQLAGCGVPEAEASAFASALCDIRTSGSLMILARAGDTIRSRGYLGWMVGARGGWLIEYGDGQDPSPVRFAPASGESIMATVEEWLGR